MLPRNVRLSFLLVQLTAIATLMRSIAFDRWVTVFASLLLLLGAAAAQRNRAWGVALMFAQAIAFPVAFMIGIAPPWFCLVGAVGMIPFLLTAPGFARLDRGATRLLATLAIAGGAVGAIAWKAVAWSVFESVPALMPSLYPHHGFVVAAVAALGIATAVRQRHLVDEGEDVAAGAGATSRARIAPLARLGTVEVAAVEEDAASTNVEDEAEDEEVLGRRAQR